MAASGRMQYDYKQTNGFEMFSLAFPDLKRATWQSMK
jgi:hypothetical protein